MIYRFLNINDYAIYENLILWKYKNSTQCYLITYYQLAKPNIPFQKLFNYYNFNSLLYTKWRCNMISPKKFIKMTTKRQKMVATSKNEISFVRNVRIGNSNSCSVAEKGHFVVYTTDRKRFMMPLAYLGHSTCRSYSISQKMSLEFQKRDLLFCLMTQSSWSM